MDFLGVTKVMKFIKLFLLFAFPLLITSCNNNNVNQENPGQTENPDSNENSNADDNENNDDKQVPTYTGMSVTNDVSTQIGVQNKIKKAANQKYDFYVKAKQTFYIEIHLDNPSQYEILSFTLNDVKYQAYEFNKGSNSELLILEAVAPSIPGNKVYNLSSIKYVDGESIKDVDLSSAKRSVDVGISYSEMPTCDVINPVASYTTFKATLSSDSKDVDVKGLYHFMVYDKDDLVVYEKYFDDTLDIFIEELEMEYDYRYEVICRFDFLDGNGTNDYVIEEGNFTTTLGIELVEGSSTSTSYSFDYDLKEPSIVISNLYYQDLTNNIITKFNSNKRTISGLYSNRNYKLFTEYYYNDNKSNGTIETEFKTLAKQPGSYSIASVSPTSDSVSFSLNISDEDLSTGVTEIALYDDETGKKVQTLSNTTNLTFDNLYSNHSYTIKIIYYNNLNDGTSNSYTTLSKSFKTYSKREPSYSFESGEINYTTAEIFFNEDDGDGTGEIISFELYRNDNPTPEYTFDRFEELNERLQNLFTNSKYVIKLNYKYDLNEGDGVIEASKTYTFKTKSFNAPSVSIALQNYSFSSLDFIINNVDDDNLLVIDNIELYEIGNETPIYFTEYVSDYITFVDLKSNTYYRAVVNYHYDLKDGNGVVYSSCYTDTSTNAYSKPNVEIYMNYIAYKTVRFTIYENTGNSTFQLISTQITNLNTNESVYYSEELELNNEIIITTLDPNSEYSIKVIYSYNLYDGKGVVTDYKEQTFETLKMDDNYKIELSEIGSNGVSIGIYINFTGDCSPVYLKKLEIIDLKTDEVVDYKVYNCTISSGNDYVNFNNIISDHEYLIKFTYSLYHNEGLDEEHCIQKVYRTPKVNVPEVGIGYLRSGANFIVASVYTNGPAKVKFIALNLYKEDELCQTITEFNYETGIYIFKNLEREKNYYIQMEYYYDLCDGNGYRDEILKSNKVSIYTGYYYGVNAELTSLGKNEATINLNKFSEEDSIITIERACLYYKNDLENPIKEFVFDSVSNATIELNDLYSNKEYVLEYYYNYRYRYDNNFPMLDNLKESISFTTLEEEKPNIFVNYDVTDSSITYNIEIKNGDEIGALTKIELLDEKNDVLSANNGEISGSFNNLISNTKYHIRATYEYTLQDGYGKRSLAVMDNGYSTLDGEYVFNDYYYLKLGAMDVIVENNKLYAIFAKKGIGWYESVVECERLGGHLITTNEKIEMDILDRLLDETPNYDSWIGGYYQDDSFHWITDEEFIFDFNNFIYDSSSVEPNNGDVLKGWFNEARYWYCSPYANEDSTLAYTLELDNGHFVDSYILTL